MVPAALFSAIDVYKRQVIIYGIILNIILHFVEMPFLAWIKHMNGFQKGFWRYDR